MIVAGLIFVAIAMLIHIYIFYLESIARESERARAVFGMGSVEEARTAESVVFGQGFYNLFLVLLTIIGVVTQVTGLNAARLTLALADTVSMLTTVAVLFITFAPHRTAASEQGTFPLLAVGSLGLGLML